MHHESISIKFAKLLNQFANWAVTRTAKLPSGNSWPLKIMIDTNIYADAVAYGATWHQTSDETVFYNGQNYPMGYLATQRFEARSMKSIDVGVEVDCLNTLVKLQRIGRLEFCTCESIESELRTQPIRRFAPSFAGKTIFEKINFTKLNSKHDRAIFGLQEILSGSGYLHGRYREKENGNKLEKFLKTLSEPEYSELLRFFRGKYADAFHLWTANQNNCFAFLTLDGPLLSDAKEVKKYGHLTWLKTRVLKPSEIIELMNSRPLPIDHNILEPSDWPMVAGTQKRPKSKPKKVGNAPSATMLKID